MTPSFAAESPELEQWQARMEKAYSAALSQFGDTPHAQYASMEDYERVMKKRKLLEDAQASWSAYRDASCAFYETARSDAGCRLRLTKERALELEALSKTP